MKIALAPGGDLLRRTGRVLLADDRVDLIGVGHPLGSDPRIVSLEDLGRFDVVVAEDLESTEAQRAQDRQIPIVIAAAAPGPDALVTDGANLGGLAHALGDLAMQRAGASASTVARTKPGKPLRSGSPVSFPLPVGRLYSSREGDTSVAPHEGALAAILVSATGPHGTVPHGVVDRRSYLEAICLAAAVLARDHGFGGSAFRLGPRFVEEAIAAGVSVASKKP